ncbi:MAG TPA: nucleotide exchange factor GrpE [Methanoregulaceae archaeon]|nr:nucleotide exchange factor GrpE [Methanoregulaceae archaeon]
MTIDEEAAEKGPVEPESGESPLDEVTALRSAQAELNERFLRLAADFENYKKRAAKDQAGRVEAAVEQVICEVLEVYDNLERAERADDDALRTGLAQIRKLFGAVLERRGVTPIACLNEPFDPALHEAIAAVPSDAAEGTVIDEVARGYCLNGRVIRYAKVAVSQNRE